MHPSLQTMLDAAQTIRNSGEEIEAAYANALGVGADDPENPSVLAVVHRNRLIGFEIDESVLDMYRNNPVELGVYVNTIIRGAFADWRDEVRKRVQR
ncbi:hypothetical protein GS896_27770 [Rhodococcus hoagii]|nr:hypothetical protein [Prescottella equi]MBM4654052.1 hypothetical protein [Prescottella equi]MBM4719685.1 hypothetical protein [Prescottella equi]NKR23482.1 hypothetical protein [Prescottella equi]NKT55906.1 hypothetical protein [Prescottella equi]